MRRLGSEEADGLLDPVDSRRHAVWVRVPVGVDSTEDMEGLKEAVYDWLHSGFAPDDA